MTRLKIFPLAAMAGFALALVAGIALAKSYTVQAAKSSVAGKTETIVVNSHGFAVYWLSGDSASHPKCNTSSCHHFWPPLKVGSAKALSKAPGVKGKLGTWRHNGLLQLTLAGHPLYLFSGDKRKHSAGGDGIQSFGGTWHVIVVSAGRASGSSTGAASTNSTGTTTGYSYSTTTGSTTTGSTTSSVPTGTTVCTYYC
jgi:predicted lipoprotein with Yx(FWY)xxD motif